MSRFSRGRDEKIRHKEELPWDIRTRKLMLSFSIKNKKPSDEQLGKIIEFFEENGIKKGSLVSIANFSKWIVGDADNENFLVKKYIEGTPESDALITEIKEEDTVMFLGVSINKIKNYKNDRSPIFKKGRRKGENKNNEYCFMVNILTNNSQIACFLLPFYDLDNEDSKDMIKNMFTVVTADS